MNGRPLSRILHVDDEPDIRNIAKLALEALGGFVLEVCASGADALEAARRFKPDLILLDVMMPGMDGPQTLCELRKVPETAEIPVVFVTAKATPRKFEEYRRLGAIDVIVKPFDPLALPEQLRRIWNRRNG